MKLDSNKEYPNNFESDGVEGRKDGRTDGEDHNLDISHTARIHISL
jgi:hypothetical protein